MGWRPRRFSGHSPASPWRCTLHSAPSDGWFPGLVGARAEATSRDALEDALDEALRFSLRQDGGDTGEGPIDFWMLEISTRPAEGLPGYSPEDLHAA